MRWTHASGWRRASRAAALLALVAAGLLAAAAPANAAVTYNATVNTMLTGVTQAQLQPIVNDLSGATATMVGGLPYSFATNRMSNAHVPGAWSAPVDMAEQYIYERLSSYGLSSVTYQTFPGDGNPLSGPEGRSVIGQITGTTKPNEVVVISAHLDDMNDSTWPTGRAPGADDNASGCSAVLYLARAFAGHSFARTVRFCLFDAEENAPWDATEGNLYGSGYYAAQCKAAGQNIVADINLDALAFNPPKSAGSIIECHTRKGNADPGGGDAAIATMWSGCITAYKITGFTQKKIANTGGSSKNFSYWTDNGAFWQWGGYSGVQGYHAVWICEEEAVNYNANWHTANDTVSTFDWAQYTAVTKSAVALAAHEAGIVK
ncbi:MAG: M28 family peptidase [Actinomycetes bacterium]